MARALLRGRQVVTGAGRRGAAAWFCWSCSAAGELWLNLHECEIGQVAVACSLMNANRARLDRECELVEMMSDSAVLIELAKVYA